MRAARRGRTLSGNEKDAASQPHRALLATGLSRPGSCYLNSGRKTILIFSDLEEDLAKGYVRDVSLDLMGFEVVALNVTKLRSDNFDPREYLAGVDAWRTRVEQSGGRWRMINDLERLDGLL